LAEPLQIAQRSQYRDLWQSSVRKIYRCARSTATSWRRRPFFDSVLMSYVTNDWQKVARIVGHALASQMDDCIIQAGDLLLVARVDALVETVGWKSGASPPTTCTSAR
jgi:hypothetical protein